MMGFAKGSTHPAGQHGTAKVSVTLDKAASERGTSIAEWRRRTSSRNWRLNLSTVPPCFGQTAMKVGAGPLEPGNSSGRLRRYWTEQGAPMHSTLTAKANDDPHDVVVVAPDAIRVAPSDDEISDLLHQAAR